MCGIAGIISLDRRPVANARERIGRMTTLLHHRGPDAEGSYVAPDETMVLGYTRLAISDPQDTTPQPLVTTDGKAVLCFNGEIYNDREVREELARKGVRFRTAMDTEVLLEGLRRHGEDFLHRLDGMWAFAYYDVLRRQLLMSRDVMGERHCFYRIDGVRGEMTFASEVQPLLADAEERLGVDFPSLVSAIRFSAAPPGRTLVAGVQRLLPGHNLLVAPGASPRTYRHRKLHPDRWLEFFARHPSMDEVIAEYETIFHRACIRRIPRDVPYIATLSGGIDTTLICAFASEQGKQHLTTLYGESSDVPRQQRQDELDEYAASAYTAKRFGTTHLVTDLCSAESVPTLLRLADNGFDGSIGLGTPSFEMLGWFVRRAERKVILISDGPDELLGGYHSDRRAYGVDRARAAHPFAWSVAQQLLRVRGGGRVLRAAGYGHLRTNPQASVEPFRFVPVHESFSASLLAQLVPDVIVHATTNAYGTIDPAYSALIPHLDPSQLRALSYATQSLPDHFNLRSDKAFLRTSVESRLPHQAPEMVEFMLAASASWRFGPDGMTTKHLLREIVARRVGPAIAYRSKYGFSVPQLKHPLVRARIPIEETLRSTSLFSDLPFHPRAREFALRPEYEKFRWPLFVLARTHDRLQQRSYAS